MFLLLSRRTVYFRILGVTGQDILIPCHEVVPFFKRPLPIVFIALSTNICGVWFFLVDFKSPLLMDQVVNVY